LRRRAVFAGREAAIDSYLGRGAFKTWPQAALADYVADGFQSRADGQVELSCAPAWEADNFAAPAYDVAAALHGLTQPVSILRAQTNSTCAIDSAAGFVSNNPRFDVETIAGSTHFLPIERPDLARGLIRRMAALG
jgi:pimeloyl-ACP methyl ester carboxylesterase